MPSDHLPEIAIIGRPNVGKSTLFNRIVGRRQAIVGKQSGLTRDRHLADADWNAKRFVVTDTGGVEWNSADELLRAIQGQAFHAVDSAAVLLLVVDAREGLVSIEARIAAELRRRGLPLLLVVNKCDEWEQAQAQAGEFHRLGLDPVFPVSAEHGDGVADLLDHIVGLLPETDPLPESVPEGAVHVAVVGRPNVGKSSLVNALLGSDRVVVSEISGTTRDAVDSLLTQEGRHYLLIDTAGIRRGARREGFAEMVSVTMARRRLRRADVALLVIDAEVGLSRQDVTVAAEVEASGCGLVAVVNKWDLIDTDRSPANEWIEELRGRMGRLSFALFAFTSAKTDEGVARLLPLVDRVRANRARRVTTSELNRLFEQMRQRGWQGPPGSPQLKYATQAAVDPPTFILFVRGRGQFDEGFRRHIENRLRATFGLEGTPIRIRVRRSERDAPELESSRAMGDR